MQQSGPAALLQEHGGLNDQLSYARSRRGHVGDAADALASALTIHMAREESVFVVLSAAEDIAAGQWPSNADQILDCARTVERDIKKMQKEHDLIATLARQLKKAAEHEAEEEIVRFCDELARHAQLEEQVLYPAAVIAGRYLALRDHATSPEGPRPE